MARWEATLKQEIQREIWESCRAKKDVKEIPEEVQADGFYRIHSSRNLIKFYN